MRKLREQITGNTAMVYHGSDYRKVYKYLCKGKWENNSSFFGVGLYSVFELDDSSTKEGRYGNYILKLYIKDLSNYWCFTWETFQEVHSAWAEQTNEDDFIDYQAKKFKLEKGEYPKAIMDLCKQYRRYSTFLETVDGIIYYKVNEGKCILSYNPYNCRPVAISDDKGKSWEKIDDHYIKQYEKTLLNPKLNKSFYVKKTNLIKKIIPNGVTEIRDYAFNDNNDLESVVIPDSVTKIGNNAFSECYRLKYITVPNSITSIGRDAFYNCISLTSINVPDSVAFIGVRAFDGCKKITNINIPDSITKIESGTFADCSNLTNIIIPNSVTYIGHDAFLCCDELADINIPDSVTKIDSMAFAGCKSLTNIIIPDSVISLGTSVFEACVNLKSIHIPNSVKKIESSTFRKCINLKSVHIPNSITEIGHDAFENCTSLTSITIPNSVIKIGPSVFKGCTGLTEINYEGTKAEWNQIEGIDKIGWNGVVNFNA